MRPTRPSRRDATAAIALSLLAVRSAADAPPREPPLRVVASFSILADIAARVGGDTVAVRALVGPDADAHVYEPTPADARSVADAELVVVNGLGFEGWIDRLVRASGYRGPVVVASRGVVPRRRGAAMDPHAWQAPGNGRRYAETIRDALIERRQAGTPLIRESANRYLQALDALARDVEAMFARVPPAERRAIVAHDAFGYLADAVGLQLLSPVAWSTGGEPSAADVARLIDLARRSHVRAVFAENVSDPRLVRRIAEESGAIVGGTLYSDALSLNGPADTYLALVRHNARTFVAGLLGLTPPSGSR